MNILSEKTCKYTNNSKSTTKQNKNSHFLVKSIFFSNPQKRFHFLEIIMNSIGRIGSRIITQQRCFQRNNVCLQNTRQKTKWTETWIIGEHPQAPLNMPKRVVGITCIISSVVIFQYLFRLLSYRGDDEGMAPVINLDKYIPGMQKWEDHKHGETPITLHHRNNPPAA